MMMKSHSISMIRKCYSYTQSRWAFWFSFVLKIVLLVISLIVASQLSKIITELGNLNDVFIVKKELVIISITYICMFVLEYMVFKCIQIYEKNTRVDIKVKLLDAILDTFVTHKEEHNISKLMDIILIDSNQIISVSSDMKEIMLQLIQCIFALYFMLHMNPLVTLVVVFSICAYVLFTLSQINKIKMYTKQQLALSDKNMTITKSILSGLRSIRISQSGSFHKKRYSDNLYDAKNLTMKQENENYKLGMIGSIFVKAWLIIGLFAAIVLISDGKSDSYSILFFTIMGKLLCESGTKLISQCIALEQHIISSKRAIDIIESRKQEKKPDVEFPKNLSEIQISNLKFSYRNQPVITNMNETIHSGITLLVGKNGRGKSTMLNLLAKCLDCRDSEIMIDDIPINQISDKSFYKNVSYIPQGESLFDISIKDNILWDGNISGLPSIEMEEMCKNVGIFDDIVKMEDGFDTVISDICNVSYGQKKKIMLAKGFLRDAGVYLLDEPLEGLDVNSKEKILDMIKNMGKIKHVIVATHKPELYPSDSRIIYL